MKFTITNKIWVTETKPNKEFGGQTERHVSLSSWLQSVTVSLTEYGVI